MDTNTEETNISGSHWILVWHACTLKPRSSDFHFPRKRLSRGSGGNVESRPVRLGNKTGLSSDPGHPPRMERGTQKLVNICRLSRLQNVLCRQRACVISLISVIDSAAAAGRHFTTRYCHWNPHCAAWDESCRHWVSQVAPMSFSEWAARPVECSSDSFGCSSMKGLQYFSKRLD